MISDMLASNEGCEGLRSSGLVEIGTGGAAGPKKFAIVGGRDVICFGVGLFHHDHPVDILSGN